MIGQQLLQQAIGQTDLTLHVQAPQTSANQAVAVQAAVGAAVQAPTGETVLIGAGALTADAPVSIQRLDLAQIQAQTGLALPTVAAWHPAAAFQLDLGPNPANVPVQLLIPIQNLEPQNDAQVGDHLYFFKRGQYRDERGQMQDTWWLVDDGYIAQDAQGNLVARTASPPYAGVISSGLYSVLRDDGSGQRLSLTLASGDYATFNTLGFSLAGQGSQLTLSGLAAAAGISTTVRRWALGQPDQCTFVIQSSDPHTTLDLSATLPPVPTPYGNVSLPQITDLQCTPGSSNLSITIDNPPVPDAERPLAGKLIVRALFDNGGYRDLKTLPGDAQGLIVVTVPNDLPMAAVRWQLVRQLDTNSLHGDGTPQTNAPLEFAGNTARLTPEAHMGAVLTRGGITFVRENQETTTVELIGGANGSNDLNHDTLTGYKVNPIAFSDDLSRCYVGGTDRLYVIDMISFKLIDTVDLPSLGNLVSLQAVGNQLLLGGLDLWLLNINPGSPAYHNHNQHGLTSIKGLNLDPRQGVSGLALAPDGHTLAVVAPQQAPSSGAGTSTTGRILIIDLNTLNLKTGQLAVPPLVVSGDIRAPKSISATADPNRFLVTGLNNYDSGLGALTLTRNARGLPASATLKLITMGQTPAQTRFDRLDIQRAESAVLVTYQGEEYALVADDNDPYRDPFWLAQFSPGLLTVLNPNAPPVEIGGRANAQPVNVGGKLGIVKDPFGKKGAPQYLGATEPLDGYGIQHLSLSEHGTSLLGQLQGYYGTVDNLVQKPHLNYSWNVNALIQAALNQPDALAQGKHFVLPAGATAQIPVPLADAPAGTRFDPETVNVSVTANLGDVKEIDLKTLAAQAILNLKLKGNENLTLEALKNAIDDFEIVDLAHYQDNTQNNTNGLILLNKNGSIYSQDAKTFKDTGVFYLAPQIDSNELIDLRDNGRMDGLTQNGDRAEDNQSLSSALQSVKVGIRYKLNKDIGKYKKDEDGTIALTADFKEFATNTVLQFVGDRPLDNPGYTSIDLSGSVGEKGANDLLDVFKVEQRLKYFGYGKSQLAGSDEITVDGQLSAAELIDLRQFIQITQGQT